MPASRSTHVPEPAPFYETAVQWAVRSAALVFLCGTAASATPTAPLDITNPDGQVIQSDVLVFIGKAARDEAIRRGIPVTTPDGKGGRIHVIGIRGDRVLFGSNLNLDSADTVDADEIWVGGETGYELDGSGVYIGQWESDLPRRTHVELDGRSFHMDPGETVDSHATHVAATMIGAGIDSEARGMASGASLLSFVLGSTAFDMDQQAAGDGLRIANHSWGVITGWAFKNGQHRWYGTQSVSLVEDYCFGFYTEHSQSYDQVVHENPKLVICKSAGNDRNNAPDPDQPWYFWDPFAESWAQAPAGLNPPPADFENDGGYDTLSDSAVSKNVITVGAVLDVTTESVGSGNIISSAFSSWGPTDDGRIKPDIVANGVSVYSASDGSDVAYARKDGTSMAAPAVAGVTAQLLELWRRNDSTDPDAATLKGIMLHTAKEAGSSPGPDYRHGWGLLDARAAADLIATDVHETWRIQERTLDQGEFIEIPIEVTEDGVGRADLRVTIAWTDPPGTPPATSVDPTDRMLVNDLDMTIVELGGPGAVYQPWVLDPADPARGATHGDNDLDNVEQIVVPSPRIGRYVIRIGHEGTLSGGSQRFSIVVSGGSIGAETLYVDADAGPGGNGSSWANAYRDLDDALSYARLRPDDLHDIWIAEGEYVPTTPRDPGDFRTISFDVPPNTRLVGGFAGDEPTRDERPGGLVTLLNGDFNGDDAAGGIERRDDNAYSVVTVTESDGFVELRDLHVRGGNADGSTTEKRSGGAVLVNGRVLIEGCVFEDNAAYYGGGVAFRDAGHGTVHRSEFIGNDGTQGGGLYTLGTRVSTIACEFRGNSATLGAGLYARNSDESFVAYSLFTGNAGESVGAIRFFGVREASVSDTTISGNTAADATAASAIEVRDGELRVTNTILWNNANGAGGDTFEDQLQTDNGTAQVFNCLLPDGPIVDGNIHGDPRFVNATGWDGSPGTADDNLRAMADSRVIDGGRVSHTKDIVDADRDGSYLEAYPFDLIGQLRYPWSQDIGCYEYLESDPPVIYVDAGGSGGDGRSWDEAYTSLDAGLAQAAISLTPTEVWIAEGVYTPQSRQQANDPRSVTFRMQSGVAIVGGFAGDELSNAERTGSPISVVLSGDIDGDDGSGDLSDNAFNVVTASGTDRSALLIDVAVEGGNADGIAGESWGAGAACVDGAALFRGVTFRNNRASQGAGLYVSGDGTPSIENARFEYNHASSLGGGIYIRKSDVDIADTVFLGNTASTGGGGLRVFRADATIERAKFFGNSGGRGGGLYVTGDESGVTARTSLFSGNLGGGIGVTGGLVRVEGSSIALNDELTTRAGGIDVEGTGATVLASNTIVANNISSAGDIEARQVRVAGNGRLDSDYCLISGWTGTIDDGVTISGNPGFADQIGPDGFAGTEDDDLELAMGSEAIDAGANGLVDPSATIDLAGNTRFFDDPATANTGSGSGPIVDIGAFEYQGDPGCNAADLAEPFGTVDLADINVFVSAFIVDGDTADLNEDGVLDLEDIGIFVGAFQAGCP